MGAFPGSTYKYLIQLSDSSACHWPAPVGRLLSNQSATLNVHGPESKPCIAEISGYTDIDTVIMI